MEQQWQLNLQQWAQRPENIDIDGISPKEHQIRNIYGKKLVDLSKQEQYVNQ